MNGRTNSAGGTLGSDMEIPLDPCTDLVGVRIKDIENLGKVRLTWVDPKDKYATPEGEATEDTDQLVSKWAYTQIVRQADRAPVNPSDGDTVCTETTRNQYQMTGFIDLSAETNVTYYYAAYAFNEEGVYSEVISNAVQPVSFSTTLSENTWEEIDQACTLGLAESLWEIGDEKNFDYTADVTGSQFSESATAVLIDFNHDDLSDGSGKAALTFATKDVLRMNSVNGNATAIDNAILNLTSSLDASIKDVCCAVNKSRYNYTWRDGPNSLSTKSYTGLFLFNMKELNYQPSADSEPIDDSGTYGITYSYFVTQANRRRSSDNWINNQYYWSWDNSGWYYLSSSGGIQSASSYGGSTSPKPLSPGFCIGKVAV